MFTTVFDCLLDTVYNLLLLLFYEVLLFHYRYKFLYYSLYGVCFIFLLIFQLLALHLDLDM